MGRINGVRDDDDMMPMVLKYLLVAGEQWDRSEFFNIIYKGLPRPMEENVMTIAEQLRQEGHQKGIEEMAKRLLCESVDPAFVSRVTGLPMETIALFAVEEEEVS